MNMYVYEDVFLAILHTQKYKSSYGRWSVVTQGNSRGSACLIEGLSDSVPGASLMLINEEGLLI